MMMAHKGSVMAKRPVVLCILDGWGYLPDGPTSSIRMGATPHWDRLTAEVPMTTLMASALDVGLPTGQMGNSEVGHMNIGAGRVVMQELPRIDQAVADGTLAENPRLAAFIAALRQSGGRVHLMGLLSPGGVHAHQDHLLALARILCAAGLTVLIHAFTDGRDTPPRSGLDYLATFETGLALIGQGAAMPPIAPRIAPRIATVIGRYYAMDRDKRWDRVHQAYRAMVAGDGVAVPTARAAIEAAYAGDQGDEFVPASVIAGYDGMRDGDGILMANFRADRAREILSALVEPEFTGFARDRTIAFADRLGMVAYSAALNERVGTLFEPDGLEDTLGAVVAAAGLKQLRIAETEKYAHVTFFFNGGREEPFVGEERILVPSPKVATYDLQPEMSASELTDRLVAAIQGGTFDLIVVNYANPDMVGHTGIIAAAVKAVETVDACLGRLTAAVAAAGGALLVTADHGNVEQMVDPETGEPHTAHTMNPVPLILAHGPASVRGLSPGKLADLAPTVLDLMGMAVPNAMTGHSLLRS